MRLRYLHIPDLVPLRNITITFGHEPILGRECTIHFIVGVNGTGKSRLLRAISEVFLHLEKGRVPPFPITIAYDLANDDHPLQLKRQYIPGNDSRIRSEYYLPKVVLAYSSGSPEDWELTFAA